LGIGQARSIKFFFKFQTRYYPGKHVQAVVLRTAYSTLKGQLVRSIMYPKPVDFRFTKVKFFFYFLNLFLLF